LGRTLRSNLGKHGEQQPGGSAKAAIPRPGSEASDDLLAWIREHGETLYTLTPRKSQHKMIDCYTGS